MGQPSLPQWRPRRTLIDLYNEKDQTLWYWRAAATLSALLIMIGFLIFPSAFKQNASLTISSKSATITAIVLLVLGYVLSFVTALICRSWIFQLDIIFVPCLSSSVLGLINILYSLSTHEKSLQWTSSSIVALVLSTISTLTYTTIALLTFRKIHIVRARDAMHRYHSESTDAMMPESELQRQQLLRLLLQQEDAKQQNPDNGQSTFKIDWPGNADRRSTVVTLRNLPRAVRSSYGNRNSDLYGDQDANPPPLPPMDSVTEEASVDPRFGSSDGLSPLGERTYIPANNSYIDGDIPGIVNTRYDSPIRSSLSNLPQLQANGYPIEKPEIQDLIVQHPTQRPEYHIVDEHARGRDQYRMVNQQGQQSHDAPRSRSRESRRIEIELADRGKARDGGRRRQELEGVEVIGSIRRVETDGWGRR
ncbi:hypothetical protein HO173_008879 [Letharia columbiana]|uniref:Uncharacterized protein n=1 Tax=Letharia columbiana TaxID=112416 RepID=A0A8H6L2B9_9LECA|nr:uncharacterized protein HO173_008879 [Letharia columbiana]KAF6232916.1 hypothetical protein HO173_008879 [Letharia columbiana]